MSQKDKNTDTEQSQSIPEGWVETTLGKISNRKQYGYTESASLEEIGPKFLRITDIQNDFINWQSVPYCPISESNYEKYKLEIGDIVIARTGNSTGATATIKEKVRAVFASYLIRFQINKKIADYNFIDFLVRSNLWYGFVASVKSGSAQGGANANDFALFPINLPPLPEQKAIANILTAFDDKIENLRAQNDTLEQIAQTLFTEWFGKYQLEDELPEGWRVGKLGEEFEISIGRTPPRKEAKWFSDTPIGKKWISIKDIGNTGIYISTTSEYLTDEAIKKFNIPIIPKNTTILSFKMTVGKLTITTDNMLSNEAIAHLKLKENTFLTSEYIYLYLQNLDFNALGSTSSIVTAINSTMIKNIDFIIPDKKIMKEFNSIISSIFNKIKYNTEQIQTLTQTRDTLLPKLMSGQLRVKNVETLEIAEK